MGDFWTSKKKKFNTAAWLCQIFMIQDFQMKKGENPAN